MSKLSGHMQLTKSGKKMYCSVCNDGKPRNKIPAHLHVWTPASLFNDRCMVDGCHESREV